jgi:hypothetical protein
MSACANHLLCFRIDSTCPLSFINLRRSQNVGTSTPRIHFLRLRSQR